jgi:hypothetical protein
LGDDERWETLGDGERWETLGDGERWETMNVGRHWETVNVGRRWETVTTATIVPLSSLPTNYQRSHTATAFLRMTTLLASDE